MKEAELAEMMRQNIKESLRNNLEKAASSLFWTASHFDEALDIMARNAAQGVMSLLAIVEIEGECPLCGSDPLPNYVAGPLKVISGPGIAHGEQSKGTLDIAQLTPKHLISKDPQGYMKCSCGLVMGHAAEVGEHINKVNGSIAQ